MNREEVIYRLSNFIICLKCEISGKVCDQNCPYQYEAGNLGQLVEALEFVIKVLDQH